MNWKRIPLIRKSKTKAVPVLSVFTQETREGIHRAYISVSYSTYDQDIKSESDKKLSDFAVYGEYNGYMNFLHLIGKLYYIGEEYFTEGKSGFENDIMKAEVIYNWSILKDMTVSGNIYYLGNNTGFKPVEEYLTYNTVKGSLNFTYEFNRRITHRVWS